MFMPSHVYLSKTSLNYTEVYKGSDLIFYLSYHHCLQKVTNKQKLKGHTTELRFNWFHIRIQAMRGAKVWFPFVCFKMSKQERKYSQLFLFCCKGQVKLTLVYFRFYRYKYNETVTFKTDDRLITGMELFLLF